MRGHVVPRRIVPSAAPVERAPGRTARAFRRRLAEGIELRPAGEAGGDPARLLRGYTPRHEIGLFDTTFFLTDPRQNDYVRFFVAYVLQAGTPVAWPRIFYKDVSLVWRVASHLTWMDGDRWIGKGEIETVVEGDEEVTFSREATTDLPFEIQTALETLNRAADRIPTDVRALDLVLRRRPDGGIAPYRDFVEPRRRARAEPRNLVNRGRPVARIARRGDPSSLRIARGYEPDHDGGIVEESESRSSLYGGPLRRFRILSRNREIQWFFFAGPRHVWLAPPQTTTTELSTYGVRTLDVPVDEDLAVPGYEYHFMDESRDPPALHSQIPEGFAGPPSEVDPDRADASAWLDRLPVVREFRARVLRGS